MHNLPLIATRPPRLSEMPEALRAVEDHGIYSNSGPVVRRFETALVEQLFGGEGACLAVANVAPAGEASRWEALADKAAMQAAARVVYGRQVYRRMSNRPSWPPLDGSRGFWLP